MPKVLILGFFDFEKLDTGGQPVKTRELYYLLCREYGEENIEFIDTKGWKKNPINLVLDLYKKTKKCSVLIMLPAHNGVEIFGRIFAFIKKATGKKIFYDVIGGWLTDKLGKEPRLLKLLKRFDGVWVETTSMKTGLNNLGMDNVTVIPNFKRLSPIDPNELNFSDKPPFKLCTFSRVMKEKGIEDAINAVKEINEKKGKKVYTLDIYGQIHEPYAERFEELRAAFPEYISYKGCVSPNESVETLKDYFLLLFPTYYHGEGLAGTLIDALSSGVPTLATDWHYNSDIINSENGFLIPTQNRCDHIIDVLEKTLLDINSVNHKKTRCLKDAQSFTPEYAFEILNKELF